MIEWLIIWSILGLVILCAFDISVHDDPYAGNPRSIPYKAIFIIIAAGPIVWVISIFVALALWKATRRAKRLRNGDV